MSGVFLILNMWVSWCGDRLIVWLIDWLLRLLLVRWLLMNVFVCDSVWIVDFVGDVLLLCSCSIDCMSLRIVVVCCLCVLGVGFCGVVSSVIICCMVYDVILLL